MKRIAFFLLFALAVSASAQLTIDHIMRGYGLTGWDARDVRWSPDGQYVYFHWKLYTDPVEKDFDTYVVDRNGKGLRKLSEEEEKDAPPVRAAWTRDHKRAVYIDEGDVILWDGKHRNLTNTNDAESNARFTRDERHVTFVRNNNLFVASLEDGSIEQVTNIVGPDEKTPLWDDKQGTPRPAREKVGDPVNSTKLASISTANGEVKWFESGLKLAPPATKQEEKTETEKTPPAAKEREVNFGTVQFSDDGLKAFVALRARDNKDAWIMAFDPATAKARVLVTMHDDAWVRRGLESGWMPDSANVWFVSEASGYAHLYTVPFAGGS